ncbi:1-deoxy-D-xylulose-5-phosphate reductoisomerase, partial [Vibrio parahaemolyticus]|nr:1-deoxy-D-xylulose-5-phosphate reductoisomerase [Vibrio parahaemolyticus]
TILGATGSIGASTLKVVAENPEQFTVVALAAGGNVAKMRDLCLRWRPKYAVMATADAAQQLAAELRDLQLSTEVMFGQDVMCQVAACDEVDTVMAAIVGAAGLLPTMAAVKAGKRVLLANKEALVMSGQLFIDAVEQHGAELM